MKVLVVGSGGREHALAWKVAQSTQVEQVFVAPGNPGTASEPGVCNVPIAADDLTALVQFARDKQIGLTIVGPEAPLVLGLVDAFNAAGLRCFGPSRQAARLEGSKAYSKDFLARHNIPTAAYGTFTGISEATAYIQSVCMPIVIKADGLAAGKGVVIAHTQNEAIGAATQMLSGGAFGAAGRKIVVEEFLVGEEASFIVMADGKHILPLATSQDHKARDDGDLGPNTGGMGAYSPAPVITPEIHARVMREVIEPTIRGMAAEGSPYVGFLYAGLMISPEGAPKVLEFNCRFGDPETQPVMMRLKSDLVPLCLAALDETLHTVAAEWDARPALGVVMAASGYPETYAKGDIISGLPSDPALDVRVFHSGTALEKGKLTTCGGRVLCVTALGNTVGDAQSLAYAAVKRIHWQGVFYRNDIGYRAIAREQQSK